MGSNNRIDARVAAIDGERVTLAGDGWELQALARDTFAPSRTLGRDPPRACAGRRRPGANRLQADLVTSMYLGDRWEYLFHCGEMRLRAFGHVPRAAGKHWIEFPTNDCWAFAKRADPVAAAHAPPRMHSRTHPSRSASARRVPVFCFNPPTKTKETPSK